MTMMPLLPLFLPVIACTDHGDDHGDEDAFDVVGPLLWRIRGRQNILIVRSIIRRKKIEIIRAITRKLPIRQKHTNTNNNHMSNNNNDVHATKNNNNESNQITKTSRYDSKHNHNTVLGNNTSKHKSEGMIFETWNGTKRFSMALAQG